jgi:uncharacterized protein YndB with AHSA1/START domain
MTDHKLMADGQPDRIEREILIRASIDRVWRVITEAEHIGTWFADAAEIDLRIGGRLTIISKEQGTFVAYLERIEPPTGPRAVLAFRGAVAPETEPNAGNSTRTEMTLTEEGGHTRLRVVESGFASLELPAAERQAHRDGNSEGWRIVTERLQTLAEQA